MQSSWLPAGPFGQGAVHPQDPVLAVDDGDQVRHGVEGALPILLGLAQGLFSSAALGHFLVGAQNPDDPLLAVAQRENAGAHPHLPAVRPGLGLIQVQDRLAGLDDPAVFVVIQLRFSHPDHLQVAAADELFGTGQAGIAGESQVAAQVLQVEVLPEHAHRDCVQDRAQHAARLFQLAFRAPALGDVIADGQDLLQPPFFIEKPLVRPGHPGAPAVAA